MVTTLNLIRVINGKELCEIACLSTDEKPTTGVSNGAILYEMDTKKFYMFDADNSQWLEM